MLSNFLDTDSKSFRRASNLTLQRNYSDNKKIIKIVWNYFQALR